MRGRALPGASSWGGAPRRGWAGRPTGRRPAGGRGPRGETAGGVRRPAAAGPGARSSPRVGAEAPVDALWVAGGELARSVVLVVQLPHYPCARRPGSFVEGVGRVRDDVDRTSARRQL